MVVAEFILFYFTCSDGISGFVHGATAWLL